MKRYEEYISTDEKWLRTIPSNWQCVKMKYLFEERSEKGHPDEALLVSSQNMGVVPKSLYGKRTVEAMKDLQLLKIVKKGDFVISLRSFQGGIEQAYYQGIISPAYTVLIVHGMSNEYFRYLGKSAVFVRLLKTLSVTTVFRKLRKNVTSPSLLFPNRYRRWNESLAFNFWSGKTESLH